MNTQAVTTDVGGRANTAHEYSVVVSARGLLRLMGWLAAAFVMLLVIHGAGTVFQLLALSATVAVLVAPAVHTLARWMPKPVSLIIVVIGGLALAVGLIAWLAMTFNHQTNALAAALHDSIARLPSGSTAAQVAHNIDADKRIDSLLHNAATRLLLGGSDPLSVAGEVAQGVVVAVIAAFLIAGGQPLVAAAIRSVRRVSMRQQLHESLWGSLSAAGSYVRRVLAISAAHGLLAALVARGLNLPGAA
ncbi:MAG TPA: hypothetical protein VGM78_03530, partial [Ilumatobacteraceae bacterium]